MALGCFTDAMTRSRCCDSESACWPLGVIKKAEGKKLKSIGSIWGLFVRFGFGRVNCSPIRRSIAASSDHSSS
jgi:hypothetical protein